MKHQLTRAAALLALTAVLLTGSASALFGKKAEEAPPEGAPQVWDLEIRTYRGIPGQGQFLASDPEGDEMTFALADEPRSLRGTASPTPRTRAPPALTASPTPPRTARATSRPPPKLR